MTHKTLGRNTFHCHGPAGVPPDVSVLNTWLVVGAMCSPVFCLSPPILLTNHCFSCSTCVSRYPRLSPYLASWCLQSCADLLSYVVCVCVC